MDRNRLKRKLAAGEVSLVAGNFESADMVDLAGSLGLFDGVWIDMERGAATIQGLADLSRAADLWGMTSFVRVRSSDPALIALTMNQGVHGVIVPHVTTREQAERIVDAAKAPPLGHRGASGGRRSYGVTTAEQMEGANNQSFVAVMIEDVAGIDNLDQILEVPHIDMYFVSHYDLALSMGLGIQVAHPDLVRAYDGAVQRIVAAGRVAAAVVGEADLEKYIGMGVRCIKAPRWQAMVSSASRAFAERVDAVRS